MTKAKRLSLKPKSFFLQKVKKNENCGLTRKLSLSRISHIFLWKNIPNNSIIFSHIYTIQPITLEVWFWIQFGLQSLNLHICFEFMVTSLYTLGKNRPGQIFNIQWRFFRDLYKQNKSAQTTCYRKDKGVTLHISYCWHTFDKAPSIKLEKE